MGDREELDALRRLAELEAKAGNYAPMQAQEQTAQQPSIDYGAAIAGPLGSESFLTAFAHHAGNMPLGLGQFALQSGAGLANLAAPEASATKSLSDLAMRVDEAMKERERQYQKGTPDSVMSYGGATLGAVAPWLSPATAAMRAPQGAGLIARLLRAVPAGAGLGYVAEKTAPNLMDVRDATPGLGTAIGAAVPAAIDIGMSVAKPAAQGVRNIADMIREGGEKNILSRYQSEITGDKNISAVVNALRTQHDLVTGGKPTAAELLHEVPEGSPLAAHQRITSRTPGGPSAQFGQRLQDQESAIEAAKQMRSAVTGPMREAALNSTSPVNTAPILHQIDTVLVSPEAPTLTQKVLQDVKDEIAARSKGIGPIANSQQTIDPEALYTVRKQIGLMIDKHLPATAKLDPKFDKSITAKEEKSIQNLIDDAIENSGGTGWRNYLREYANRSKAIEGFKERQEFAYKPDQPTSLGGGINVAEQVRTHAPQMLSRPMMIANYILKKLSGGVEPRLDAEAAARYLNPKQLADALEKYQLGLQRGSAMADVLRRWGPAATAGAVQEIKQ